MPEREPPDAPTARGPSIQPRIGPIRSGHDNAFEVFYRRNVKQLISFLLVQGAQLADAVDIVQDTLCEAYARWPAIDNHKAWAHRVASRALVRKIANLREVPVGEPPEPNPLLRTTDINHWEQQHDLVRILTTLPPRQRQVMAWYLFCTYTPTEIAKELSIKPSTVRANLRKARQSLATRLAGRGDVDD
jgi:RNA polymerase sigma-70 factor (ECF subfamily)